MVLLVLRPRPTESSATLPTNFVGTFAAEKPSNSGLKLDLDRFRRDIDHVVRAARKDADEFIAAAKKAKAGELPDEPE